MPPGTGNRSFDAAVANAYAQQQASYALWQAPAAAAGWASGTTYGVGQFVSFGGFIWRSTVTGNQGNTPSTSPSQWQAMTYSAMQNGVRSADVTYYQAVMAAGQQFGVPTPAAQEALVELGLAPIPAN